VWIVTLSVLLAITVVATLLWAAALYINILNQDSKEDNDGS
jgi:hypothetical protein